MENLLFKNSSPTLLQAYREALTKQITTACNVFRSKKATIELTVLVEDNLLSPQVLSLSDLPQEFRKAFHDYATRLIAERHQLDRELLKPQRHE
jgi:hypothetical protein